METPEERARRHVQEQREREAARRDRNGALGLFALFVMAPALFRWMAGPGEVQPAILIAVASAGGALVGLAWRREARLAGLVGGAVAGFCAMFATDVYLTERHQIVVVELLLPIAAGFVAGVAVYHAVLRVTHRSATGPHPRERD